MLTGPGVRSARRNPALSAGSRRSDSTTHTPVGAQPGGEGAFHRRTVFAAAARRQGQSRDHPQNPHEAWRGQGYAACARTRSRTARGASTT